MIEDEEVYECSACGDDVPESEMTPGTGMCRDCLDEWLEYEDSMLDDEEDFDAFRVAIERETPGRW